MLLMKINNLIQKKSTETKVIQNQPYFRKLRAYSLRH